MQACEYSGVLPLKFKLTNRTEHSNSWVEPAEPAQVGELGLGEVVLLEVLESCPQTLSSLAQRSSVLKTYKDGYFCTDFVPMPLYFPLLAYTDVPHGFSIVGP